MAWTDVPDFTVGQWTSNGTWSVTNDATTAQPPPRNRNVSPRQRLRFGKIYLETQTTRKSLYYKDLLILI